MFKLKAKHIEVETGGIPIITLHKDFGKENDIQAMDRVKVQYKNKFIVASVDISEEVVLIDEVGIFDDVWRSLKVSKGEIVELKLIGKPESTKYIRKKMDREELSEEEIKSIVSDIVYDRLTDVEMASFVAASYIIGLSLEETENLTRAIVNTGDTLNLKKKVIADKHCIGGVPGNRTTMVIVPILASLGILIPKTSSRSITSPAGTADTMEVFANVAFSIEEIKKIVKKTNGCIVWGGAVNFASADDKLIRVRHPLSLDPEGLMLASVMAKKIAASSNHVIFDLPIGFGAKLQSLGEARHMEREFQRLAERFNIKTKTIITDGNQPIGKGIGPNLEARDILWLFMNDERAPMDLRKKGTILAGNLLELCGAAKPGQGHEIAERQIENGKAYQKFREIIEAQGGNPDIKPEDIKIGEYSCNYEAEKTGKISNINNRAISKIAKSCGCPADKEAGMYLHKNYGDNVTEGEVIFTIYSRSERKIQRAIELMKKLDAIQIT